MRIAIGVCSCLSARASGPHCVSPECSVPASLSELFIQWVALNDPTIASAGNVAQLAGVVWCGHCCLPQLLPGLPVSNHKVLLEPAGCSHFFCQVWAFHDYQQLLASGFSVGKLVAFHSRYKFMVMAHSNLAYRRLGLLVGQAALYPPGELARLYLAELMLVLAQEASREQQTNALQHLQGFLKKRLSMEEKHQLGTLIAQYRTGVVPLQEVMLQFRCLLSRYPDPYLAAQTYFQPFPDELGLCR